MACSPIISWQISGETQEIVKGFICLISFRKKTKVLTSCLSDEATNLYLAYHKFILIYIPLKMNVYKVS